MVELILKRQMVMPSVTVVIVNWNSGAHLAKCLNHLMQQSLPPTRILVMDNASDDGSVEHAQQIPEVTVRLLGANLGFAVANNLALSECDTDFVALLNPDAFPEQDWLLQLMLAASTYTEVAVFGSRQMIHELPSLVDGLGDIYHISGLVWRDGYNRLHRMEDNCSYEVFSACACAALYRRDVLVKTGGFDEDYFCYVEDIDLGFRIRLAGYTCLYVPDAVVHHIGSATSGGPRSDFSVYYGHRNIVWTFIKNMPGALLWTLLPLHIALNLITLVYFSIRGQGNVIWQAKLDAIKGIPKMWRKRRKIQTERRASLKDIWRVLDKRIKSSL
jgi:GT2 family glycosyltransferase